MSTKFRSACDRCHDAKVRCSGDMPCQGCIVSKNLCFYSVSSVLGRPRGTKNKTSRRRAATSTASDGQTTSNADGGGATAKRPSSQRPMVRRRRTKETRSEPDLTSMATSRESEVPSLPNSGLHTPTDSLWFLSDDSRHTFGVPDPLTCSDFRFDCFTPTEATTPHVGHTPPSLHSQFDASMDLSMSDFATPVDETDATSFPWGGGMYLQESSKATMDASFSIPSPPTSDNASSKTAVARTCNCLQHHAELLSSPIIAEMNACSNSDDAALSLDKVLSLSKQGIETWRGLISCPICSSNNDQEAMLLALMSIRPVTRYLQRLAPRYTNRARSDSKVSTSYSVPRPRQVREPCRLMVGTLEIEDEERTLVYRMLFQKTVQRVRQTLHALQMMQYRRKKELLVGTCNRTAGVEDYHASSSLSHTQQITHALATALQDLESSFHSD
ncbi:hypothetical protein P280DRAFT_470361 [Massarina eburnea CBS 473.64]|uniref:Zn(2)-C6 fungal-type domain-containing protein n=1 Tax=Massarina eburnea CBS 473.64 TaxID=1395130 RepID=A0A6A6RW00_9PLEO|nr:hypothetical protein P280DRAFT_470361 [Massarina eburnea CBS 473.64]